MIRLFTDSTASLPAEVLESGQVSVASLFVNHQGKEYEDARMDVDEFYSRIHTMVDDIPTSSQPPVGWFEQAFEQAARAGDSVLGVFISSKMSGTIDTALNAAHSVAARCASFKYLFIDSTSNCGDEGMAVLEALDSIQAGNDLEHSAQRALFGIQSSRFLFTPESLAFLRAGGRIGKAAALLGSLVRLTPVLTVKDWETTTFAKVRSRKKALEAIARKLEDDMRQHGGLRRIVVHYIGASEPARVWARDVVEPLVGRSVDVRPVSPVIGVHVGPAVGVAYQCNRILNDKFTGNIQTCLRMS